MAKPPTPLTADERSHIVDLARTGMSRNDIAREVGRSTSTVTKVCTQAGVTFDRSATKAATAARQADNAARRAELSERLLVEANRAIDDSYAPYRVYNFGGKDNTYAEHVLDTPPTQARRDLMVVAGIAIQRHADLERIDQDSGIDEASSLIGALASGLEAAAAELRATPDDDASEDTASEDE